jgi:glycosyltransferase involved in cell wall biosynthesis
MSIEISVVVCTYNRLDVLPRALESLVEQTLAPDRYEILVVDNGSTEPVGEAVRQFSERHARHRIRLGYARNKGFQGAMGRYVAFLDDDAKASEEWLSACIRCFKITKPEPMGVGGPIRPFYVTRKPGWFKDEYETRTWGDHPRSLKRGEAFSGSNMVFLKQVLEQYGGFHTGVGVKGVFLSTGEETSLYQHIWRSRSDATFYYSPDLIVFHLVPSYKMTPAYHLKRAIARGQAEFLLSAQHRPIPSLLVVLKAIITIVMLSVRAVARFIAYPAYQNWIIERLTAIAVELGRLLMCIGIRIRLRQRQQ